jgi:putative Mg2+ transporter-C (MgtC) family protein
MELLLRIFVAMILGMLIGNERKNRMKSAGMRTHALVALGAALMMVVSKYGFSDTVQGDGARLAAQVVSGVGFLGAGMIFVRHNLVSGLTTAAGVWTTAGIGLTIGAGMYFVGVFSALMMVIMQSISHRIPYFSSAASSGLIRVSVINKPGAIEELKQLLLSHKIDIQSIQIQKTENEKIKLEFDVIYPRKMDKTTLFCTLAENNDIISVGE